MPNNFTSLDEALKKVDEELYFLAQDGYGHEWRESKANEIKEIVQSAYEHGRKEFAKETLRKLKEE